MSRRLDEEEMPLRSHVPGLLAVEKRKHTPLYAQGVGGSCRFVSAQYKEETSNNTSPPKKLQLPRRGTDKGFWWKVLSPHSAGKLEYRML